MATESSDKQLIFVVNGVMIKIIAALLAIGVGFIGWLGQSTVALREAVAANKNRDQYVDYRMSTMEARQGTDEQQDKAIMTALQNLQLSQAALGVSGSSKRQAMEDRLDTRIEEAVTEASLARLPKYKPVPVIKKPEDSKH